MMELNKYDLVEWVVELIIRSDYHLCKHCMFLCHDHCPNCWEKDLLIKELIKKYNL